MSDEHIPKDQATILIVDDEKNTRDGLSRALKRNYTILVAEQGNPFNPYQADKRLSVSDLIYLGPFLWRSRSTLLRYQIEREIERWQKAVRRFTISDVEESDKKRVQIEKHIGWLQSLLDQW